MKSTASWKSGFSFEAQIRNHTVQIDSPEIGGKDTGPTPKEMLITSAITCTGMDVVSLLRKNKIDLREFKVTGSGDARAEHPRIFGELEFVYDLKVEFQDLKAEIPKILECVDLSMTKYCPVSATVAAVSPIFYTVVVNGEIEGRGQAKFQI